MSMTTPPNYPDPGEPTAAPGTGPESSIAVRSDLPGHGFPSEPAQSPGTEQKRGLGRTWARLTGKQKVGLGIVAAVVAALAITVPVLAGSGSGQSTVVTDTVRFDLQPIVSPLNASNAEIKAWAQGLCGDYSNGASIGQLLSTTTTAVENWGASDPQTAAGAAFQIVGVPFTRLCTDQESQFESDLNSYSATNS